MGYLLTFGVLAFQVLILFTIFAAAKVGRKALLVVTIAWIAFTLFGSIFTAGLLLLQLLTIWVAYAIGRASSKSDAPLTSSSAPKESGSQSGWVITIVLIAAGMMTGKFLGRESANAKIDQVERVRAAKALEAADSTSSQATEAAPQLSGSPYLGAQLTDPQGIVDYSTPHNARCFRIYQDTIARVPEDASLGYYADTEDRAQKKLDSCVRRR